MIRLLLARLLPYRSFPKFLALHGVAVLLVAYISSRFTSFDTQGTAHVVGRLFEGASGWHAVAGLTRWFAFVPAFFTVQLVAAELELRLVRTQVIAGLEPHDVVAVWTLQSALLAAFGTAVAAVVAAVLGASGLSAMVMASLGLFLFCLIFLSGAVCVAAYLRRPVPALALLLLWPFAIEPMIGFVLEHYELTKLKDFLPFTVMAQLVPWPEDGIPIDPSLSPATLAALGYGVLAIVLTWIRLKRTDL